MPDPLQLESLPPEELLRSAASRFPGRLGILTSFQDEGMVLLDMAARCAPGVRVLTIDTGRLPAETLSMVDTVRQRYGMTVEVVQPDRVEVAAMVARHGLDLFRNETALRLLCCEVRKVRPLQRALAGLDAWAVGLRRTQADTRALSPTAEYVDGRWKLSPLAAWTAAEVRAYLERHQVPRHPLYARGYRSIGCDPCTRPVSETEDERAGRWWWEAEAPKECGIHFTVSGQVRRRVDVLLDEVLAACHA